MNRRHSTDITLATSLVVVAASLLVISSLRSVADDVTAAAQAATPPERSIPPGCFSDPFADQVWAKVGERTCLNCHTEDGEASESALVLRRLSSDPVARAESMQHNRDAFTRMALAREETESRLLLKVTGSLDHGGGEVLEPGTTGFQILERFVERLTRSPDALPRARPEPDELADAPDPFAGVMMIDDQRLLRRITLSLAGRLPSPEERIAIDNESLEAIPAVLDQLMQEEAFYDRLEEGFNDIFLTLGYDGLPERVLSYNHFGETRHWTQEHDLSEVPESERTKARYALTDDYRAAILREPLELISYIVRNDRPFTEIVTADYILVTPYTARGYGIHDELVDRFDDPDDPFEYIPTRLAALRHRDGPVQESKTGFYPHAGMLSLFHYLKRYPTTETNRNRLRARMYYQHFLGVDVMELAPRVTDAAAVGAKFANPTMEAPDCVVCHTTIDPVAGLFQDFYNEEGSYEPRPDGWFTDMFPPGFESEPLPDEERWRALQWLGERTADDPRFAVAMVEHVYTILMGRRPLLPPQDIDDPWFSCRRRAYWDQRAMIERVAKEFVNDNFNLRTVFKALVVTPHYRADGLAAAIAQPHRQAELEDIGLVRLLGPEQLHRKLVAIFGSGWDSLNDDYKILYGGIDSQTVTERITEPSGAMGAIQRMMANDVACQHVARDFTTDAAERRLFPHIELDVVPGRTESAEPKIREAIVHLHQRLLGRDHEVDHPEVDRTYELFVNIVESARMKPDLDRRESYFCRGIDDQRVEDPDYTLRAWRAVVTYLLRQHDFLYE